jgi:hypothetical protein
MDIAERYVRLAHGIHAHHDGFIDSYIGPPDWSEPVSLDLKALEDQCSQLEAELAALETGLLEVGSRRAFLTAQVRAMRTILRLKLGENLSFTDETLGLYDIEPERTPEAVFEAGLETLEGLLPGVGPIMDRWQTLRDRVLVPPEKLPNVLEVLNTEFRARTKRLFPLPDIECIELALVNNKPWGGYNWYLGEARSLVEINTDLPSYLYTLPDLIAHEGYPGHHTERVFKDRLFREQGHAEYSLQLLNAPEAVLAEGIATNALEVIGTPEEMPELLHGLARDAGLNVSLEELEVIMRVHNAMAALDDVGCNATMKFYQDGASEHDVLEYLSHYGLQTPERARKRLEFIRHARGYMFTYSVGYRLVNQARQKNANMFYRLLSEPFTPRKLRDLA